MPKHARTDANDSFETNPNNQPFDSEEELDQSAEYDDSTDLFFDDDDEYETVPRHYSGDTTQAFDAYEDEDESQFDGDTQEYPDALESLTPNMYEGPLYEDSSEDQLEQARAESWEGEKGKKPKKHLTLAQKKSRRMRRVLIAVILLIIVLIGALGYLGYLLFTEAQNEATQQALQQGSHDTDQLKEEDANDPSTATKKTTEVPNLTLLLGKTQDEAIVSIGRGATVVSSLDVGEENNQIKTNVKLSLTDEPGDSRSGTPTVYLGLNEEGIIISAGYSAATASLGYGGSSFRDVVNNEGIIEATLTEAGLALPAGSAVLPTDSSLYSTYDSAGSKLVSEKYAFSGSIEQDGVAYEWSAVLRYDYTAANASDNLADTIRQIYVYVNYPGVTVSSDVAGTETEADAEVGAESEPEGEPETPVQQ